MDIKGWRQHRKGREVGEAVAKLKTYIGKYQNLILSCKFVLLLKRCIVNKDIQLNIPIVFKRIYLKRFSLTKTKKIIIFASWIHIR